MKDLIIYIPQNEKIVRICEGDGCNLSQEDINNGYVDYLYYDVFDPQNLQDVEDGGMVLLKKPIKEEFDNIATLVYRVLSISFGDDFVNRAFILDLYTILSGKDEWYSYLKKG